MQIHELPTGIASFDDYLAMDDGTSTRKAHFSGFNAAENPVTFTSRDESNPSDWKGFSAMESGSTVGTLMNRISAGISNVRYLRNFLGTTALGTTATTITGAIRELAHRLGNVTTGLEAESITGMIKELRVGIGKTLSYTSSADVTVPYSTPDSTVYAAIGSLALTKGTWVVICKARFSSNSTGVRRLNLSDTSASGGWLVSYPAASGIEDIQMIDIVSPDEETTYYLNAYQNSGANLTCPSGYVRIRAIKIGISA